MARISVVLAVAWNNSSLGNFNQVELVVIENNRTCGI